MIQYRMSKLLGADWGFLGMMGVIIFMFVVMIMFQNKKRSKAQGEYNSMIDSLRVGVRVKTVGGVIGKILEIREEAVGFRTVLLETGSEKSKSIVLYDIQAIYGIVDDLAIAQSKLDAQKTDVAQENKSDNGVQGAKNTFETQKPKRKSEK